MKKQIVAGLLCALMLSAAGCGDKASDNTGLVKEPLAESEETAQGENAVQDNARETAEAQTTETEAASDSDLYEAFKNGTAKAKYRGTGDATVYLETRAALTEGQSYTVEEIVEALKQVGEYSDMNLAVTNKEFSMIDCGSTLATHWSHLGASEPLMDGSHPQRF